MIGLACYTLSTMKRSIFLFLTTLLLIPPTTLFAANPPNDLLSDAELQDANAMDLPTLTQFVAHKGALANTIVEDIDGVTRNAADVIYRVAQTYSLSPKFLLALLQREQSLVEDAEP